MEFVFDDVGARVEYEAVVTDPTARVSDLAQALGTNPMALVIDGRFVAGSVGLRASGLVSGSLVAPATAISHRREDPPPWEARVVGGLDAGNRLPLRDKETTVSRIAGPGHLRIDHSGVSRRHCLITASGKGVTITDLGSRNGIDVNGVRIDAPAEVSGDDSVGIGDAAVLRIVPTPSGSEHALVDMVHGIRHGWRVPFHRQARETPPPNAPLAVPVAPQYPNRSAFLYASLIAPVGLAVLTVWMFHDPLFAAFALIAPLGMLAGGLEDRLRGRGGRRRAKAAYAAELAHFAAQLTVSHRDEVRRRRAVGVDPAEVAFQAQAPGARLWERRAGAADFLEFAVALGDQPWRPELAAPQGASSQEPPAEVIALLAEHSELTRVPVSVDLKVAPVLGIDGHRDAALAAARALLCQVAVTSGPADLAVAVFTHSAWAAQWEWTKWLPHVLDRGQGTTRMLAVGRAQADALAGQLLAAPPFANTDRGALLVLVDGASLLEGRVCPLRDLISATAGSARAIVLAEPLPALCEAVLTVRPSGSGELRHVSSGEHRGSLLVTGVREPTARAIARALARFEDPELALTGAGLPAETPLLPLLDLTTFEPGELAARWRTAARTLRARAVLGVTETGRYEIDLDDDGPHALIAGTTGSGKSELLRSLVTSLAMGNDPEHLAFVLVDYKGGGALDDCARLPHVAGLVTDLDEQLSMRALRCLEAELRRRERQLRGAGVSDFRAYQQLRDARERDLEPMPRMAVVIDEFATLVKALPDFVDKLVDVAQRGRSLGVHLVMATQRPAGSVSDAIKANVKLRIALRLESAEDSRDVIDSSAAATIGPRQWGRAYRRIGGGEVEAVQTALATTVTVTGAEAAGERLRLRPFAFGSRPAQPTAAEAPPSCALTDLRRLVQLARDAFAAEGLQPPRSPWPDPLPATVPLDGLPARAAGLQTATDSAPTLVLADDPDGQRQVPLGWDPEAGNLLVFGAVGSGTTTALASVALSWARAWAPDQLHVFVLDHGAGALAPLAGLPHAAGFVRTADRERLIRLVGMLTAELERRKADGGAHRRWLVVVDGLGALLTGTADDPFLAGLADRLAPVYAEGTAVGISFAGSADRVGAIPAAWQARTAQKLVLRLADTNEYGLLGIPRREVPAAVTGRGIVAATRQVVQVATAGAGEALDAAVARLREAWPGRFPVPTIQSLPDVVRLAALGTAARVGAHPWTIPIGLAQEYLAEVTLTLHEHDHAVIVGPPRSGRSTLLCAVASGLLGADGTTVLAYAPRSSPLRRIPEPARLAATVEELRALVRESAPPQVVLVDDADLFDDFTGVFTALVTHEDPAVHVIAVARNEGLVRSGTHWLGLARRGRCGVLLTPDSLDGDLFGVMLPRRAALTPRPGRGYLVADGSYTAIQGAVPEWESA